MLGWVWAGLIFSGCGKRNAERMDTDTREGRRTWAMTGWELFLLGWVDKGGEHSRQHFSQTLSVPLLPQNRIWDYILINLVEKMATRENWYCRNNFTAFSPFSTITLSLWDFVFVSPLFEWGSFQPPVSFLWVKLWKATETFPCIPSFVFVHGFPGQFFACTENKRTEHLISNLTERFGKSEQRVV